jgi:hypothetical protein
MLRSELVLISYLQSDRMIDIETKLLCRKVFFFFFSIQPPVAVGAVEIADIVYINRTVEGYLCMNNLIRAYLENRVM